MKSLLLLVSCSLAFGQSLLGQRVLVLLEDLATQQSFSQYFQALTDGGFELSFYRGNNPPALQKYGEWLYDHCIIFDPEMELNKAIKVDDILDFIDSGHNVIIGASEAVSEDIREVAYECDIEIDESGNSVLDHVNWDISDYDGLHSLVVGDIIPAPSIIGTEEIGPVLFRGVGMDVPSSPLLFPLLRGSSSSYCNTPLEPATSPLTMGKSTVLLTAVQARNNARILFAGSVEIFGDKFFTASVRLPTWDSSRDAGNKQLCVAASLWTLQARGHLRLRDVEFRKIGGVVDPPGQEGVITIKDDLFYSVVIEEWSGSEWIPYQADDVQLEVKMLDPYIRKFLTNGGNGKFTTEIKLPDVYGIYTLRIHYRRLGYSVLESEVKMVIRPFRHNQFERFISSAYPYYAGALSMLLGLVLFSLFFLYNRDPKTV